MTEHNLGYCTFRVDGARYALDIRVVREVNGQVRSTTAFGAPSFVRGLLNLRGQVVTVLDTAALLGGRPSEETDQSRLIILRTTGELARRGLGDQRISDDLIGLHVDAVTDVINVPADRLESVPAASQAADLAGVIGVVRVGEELCRVLDPGALLEQAGSVAP